MLNYNFILIFEDRGRIVLRWGVGEEIFDGQGFSFRQTLGSVERFYKEKYCYKMVLR